MPTTNAFAGLLLTPEPAELGPGPRSGVLTQDSLNAKLGKLFEQENIPVGKRQLIRALLLLWHDHPEPAHRIVQDFEMGDGAFIHGILHRREPDFSNATYWFRRVGQHPVFPEIARRVTALLSGDGGLLAKLVVGGRWDPFAFIAACERASEKDALTLRRIQQLESEVLLSAMSS